MPRAESRFIRVDAVDCSSFSIYTSFLRSVNGKVQAAERIPVVFSDHLLLRMVIEVGEQRIPGRGQ